MSLEAVIKASQGLWMKGLGIGTGELDLELFAEFGLEVQDLDISE